MHQDIQVDRIHIHGLRLKCHIGVTDTERSKRQTIMADITMKCDLSPAGKSDRLGDTVDYSVIAKKIVVLTAKKKWCLLEALAHRINEICLANPKVKEVTVKVAKKVILPNVSSVEVEITRKRE